MELRWRTSAAFLRRKTRSKPAADLRPAIPGFPSSWPASPSNRRTTPKRRAVSVRRYAVEPNDSYANDFLGTVYFLEDNLEAALKYWNRAGKPHIDDVREDPTPRVSPVLLDHAFAFSPAATLTLPQFLDSNARLRGMGIFQPFHFDLNARSDGNFDVVFRARELDGFGNSKLESLFLFFQGLPFQEVNPQYYNLRSEAINFISMYRWDAQKRRIFAALSGALRSAAQNTAGILPPIFAARTGPSVTVSPAQLRCLPALTCATRRQHSI